MKIIRAYLLLAFISLSHAPAFGSDAPKKKLPKDVKSFGEGKELKEQYEASFPQELNKMLVVDFEELKKQNIDAYNNLMSLIQSYIQKHPKIVNTKFGQNKETLLHYLVIKPASGPIIKLILEMGANANALDQNKKVPLFRAMLSHDPQIINLLLNYHANANYINTREASPLQEALYFMHQKLYTRKDLRNDLERIKTEKPAKNEIKKSLIEQLLAVDLSIKKSLQIINILLEHGANANRPIRGG